MQLSGNQGKPYRVSRANSRSRRRQLLRCWAFRCCCNRCESGLDDTRDIPCPRCVPRKQDGKLPTYVAIGDVPLRGVLQLHVGTASPGLPPDRDVGRDRGDGEDGGSRSSDSVAGEGEPGAAEVSGTRDSSSDGGCGHVDRQVSTRASEGLWHWRCSACGLRLAYDDDAALFGPLAAVAAAAVSAPAVGAPSARAVGPTRGSSPPPKHTSAYKSSQPPKGTPTHGSLPSQRTAHAPAAPTHGSPTSPATGPTCESSPLPGMGPFEALMCDRVYGMELRLSTFGTCDWDEACTVVTMAGLALGPCHYAYNLGLLTHARENSLVACGQFASLQELACCSSR